MTFESIPLCGPAAAGLPRQYFPPAMRLARSLLALAALAVLVGCAAVPRTAAQDTLAEARHSIRAAHRATGDTAIRDYLDAAQSALAVATDDSSPAGRRAEATTIYNSAVARCAAALDTRNPGEIPGYSVAFAPPRNIDRFLVADDIRRKHLKEDVRREGFGGALVGLMDGPSTASPNRPPKGFAEPWTAVAVFGTPARGRTPVTIRLIDPRLEDEVRLAGSHRPLAGDFSAPLAFYPHPNEFLFGVIAMMRSDRSSKRSSILFYEPFDPKKTPILFVHGLMSSPHAWLQVANELNADPEFRRRYQVWSYFYPTGAPIAANAMGLRAALEDIARRHPLRDDLVIVGHSMGGILTRMQVTNSKRELFRAVFRGKADAIYESLPPDALLKRALVFRANPHVSRVIFIATPHRGSRLATLRISSFAGSLIRMPVTLVREFNQHAVKLLQQIDPSIRAIPSSIRGLSPDSPLLLGVDKLEMPVPSHSIIGNRGRDHEPIAGTSDGIVPYWSSHLPTAESEILVPTGHDAFNHPKSIAELRRILAR